MSLEAFDNASRIVINASDSYSLDSSIIEASVTLLVGVSIFLTLGWKLYPHGLVSQMFGGEKKTTDPEVLELRRILYAVYVIIGLTVGFALFPEIAFPVYSLKISIARIFFIISIAWVISCIVYIINHPPKTDNKKTTNTDQG
jgi:hypothetical protein